MCFGLIGIWQLLHYSELMRLFSVCSCPPHIGSIQYANTCTNTPSWSQEEKVFIVIYVEHTTKLWWSGEQQPWHAGINSDITPPCLTLRCWSQEGNGYFFKKSLAWHHRGFNQRSPSPGVYTVPLGHWAGGAHAFKNTKDRKQNIHSSWPDSWGELLIIFLMYLIHHFNLTSVKNAHAAVAR